MFSIHDARGQLNLDISDEDIEQLDESKQALLLNLIEISEATTVAEAAVITATDNVQACIKTLGEHEAELEKLRPKISATDAVKDHLLSQARINMERRGHYDAIEAFNAEHPPRDAAPDTRAALSLVDRANSDLDFARADLRAAIDKMGVMRRRLNMSAERWQKANPPDALATQRAAAAAFVPNGPNKRRPPTEDYSKLRTRVPPRVRGVLRPAKA